MSDGGLRFQALADPEKDRSLAARRGRLFTLVAAATVTLLGLIVALVLGTYGYEIRRSNAHERRLKGILVQTPTVYQVTEGLKEKAPLVLVVDSPESLALAIERWGSEREAQILEKTASYPQTRVFDAGDMYYFVFFDEDDIMRDYVFVSKRERKGGDS